MRLISTFFLLFIFSTFSYAQKITGIWRGHFSQQDVYNPFSGQFTEDKYKYEIQIHQLPNDGLEGVTYSYKTIIFYGKSSMHGLFNKRTKNILIKEIKMLDLKMSGQQSIACLMTCYLDYSKVGKVEILSGTYTSQNKEQKIDCGSGTVYLEKVTTSDFEKESFLTQKIIKKAGTIAAKKDTTTVNKIKLSAPKNITNKNKRSQIAKQYKVVGNKQNNKAAKPGAEAFVISKNEKFKSDSITNKIAKQEAIDTIIKKEIAVTKKLLPPETSVPKVLKERSNHLVKTIVVDEKQVQIDYYDNGEIDNDTISVYHNNELVLNHRRLSNDPITLNLKLDEAHSIHEIITVAENLGDIPPNTALMVITAGKKRYEVFITSDEQMNAKVILEYKSKESVKVH